MTLEDFVAQFSLPQYAKVTQGYFDRDNDENTFATDDIIKVGILHHINSVSKQLSYYYDYHDYLMLSTVYIVMVGYMTSRYIGVMADVGIVTAKLAIYQYSLFLMQYL